MSLVGDGFELRRPDARDPERVRWIDIDRVHLAGADSLGELEALFETGAGDRLLLSEMDDGWDELMLDLPRHLRGFPDWTALWTGPVGVPVCCLLWQRAGS